MARFTSVMLSALMCSLAFSYTVSGSQMDDASATDSSDMAPVSGYRVNGTESTYPSYSNNTSSTDSMTGGVTGGSKASSTDEYHYPHSYPPYSNKASSTGAATGLTGGSAVSSTGEYNNHHEPVGYGDDHKSTHHSEPVQWEEDDYSDDQQATDDDCDDESSGDAAKSHDHSYEDKSAAESGAHDHSYEDKSAADSGAYDHSYEGNSAAESGDDSSSNSSTDHKKTNWRDIINDKYQPAVEEIYTDAQAVLHKWGLLSVKSDGSSQDDQSRRYGTNGHDNSGDNSSDDCTLNEFEYNSRSCKAYGMFDDAKYNETQTAHTRSKGLMAMSEPLYLSKSEVNGRTLGQLGVHFAMCEDYNKKSGAQFRLGLYEKQRSAGRTSWGSKSETWSLVAKTDLQKFNRRGDEYSMFSVDANSTIALKPNTYYTIITTIAPGNSLTMFTDDADSRAFSSFDFGGTTNNLPQTWDGKKSRNWSPVSMELAMCRTKK